MTRSRATPEIQVDDGVFRVTKWSFSPGAETGWHRHDHHYVVVPLTSGHLSIEASTEVADAELTAGSAYSRSAGVEHNVINANPFQFTFVEIELLDHSPAGKG